MKKARILYSNFYTGNSLKGKNKFPLLLKSTKSIISNSKLFNDYLKKYMESIQKLTFKKPDIMYYPLLKKNSSALIPLNKTQYNTSIDKINENKSMKNSSSCINFFISNKQMITKRNSNVKINKEEIYKMDFPISPTNKKIDYLKKKRNTIGRCLSATALKKGDKRNNILIADFLHKWNDSNLKYEEDDIFNKEEVYKKFIEDKINYIKENKLENITTNLESSFEHLNGENITLKIFPLRIIFTPLNDKDNKYKENILSLPLSFQFLFYYKGIQFFIKFLLATIKFNNDYSNIYFNDNDFYDLIRNINDNSDNDTIISERPTQKKISLKNSESFFHQKLIRKSRFKQMESDSNSEIKKTIDINSSERNIHSKNDFYNEYEFIWITPLINYNVRISIPYITFDSDFSNKTIMRYIDKELFLFLLKNNFLNWDFYIINYLFSIKLFRKFIEYHLSKRNKKEIMFSSFETIEKNGINVFSLSQRKIFQYKKKDLYYCFFNTNETNQNNLYTIYSYIIKVEYEQLNSNKNWVFKLNFDQMKFLNHVNKYESLEKFIPKMLISNFQKGELKMDFSVFQDFSPNILNYHKKEADIEIYKNNDIDYFANIIKGKFKKLNLQIEKPYIEKSEFNLKIKHNIKEKKSFQYDFLRKLDELKLNEWPNFIMNNKKQWEIIPNDYINKISSVKDLKNGGRKKSVFDTSMTLKKCTRTFRKLNSAYDFKK